MEPLEQVDRCELTGLHSRTGKQASILKGFYLVLHWIRWRRSSGSHAALMLTESRLSPTEEASQFRTFRIGARACFSGAASACSLILIQYPHVFVRKEVQERVVANGLVNITHCDFFGNPGPKNKGCYQV